VVQTSDFRGSDCRAGPRRVPSFWIAIGHFDRLDDQAMKSTTREPPRDITRESHQAKSDADQVMHGADEVRHQPVFRGFARVGILARAVVYVVVGGLILQTAAKGHASSHQDSQGAFAEIRRQPAGTEILALLAAGLAAYAVWRLVEACSRRPRGQQISRWTRAGWLAVGCLYIFLCISVIRILEGSKANEGPAQHPSSFAASILHLAAGPALLGLIASAIAVGGIALVVWGVRHDYGDSLRFDKMSAATSEVAHWSGMVGNTARGAAVLLVAWSFLGSAVSDDPSRAKSLDAAFQMLAGRLGGVILLVAVGVGFLSFGLHSVIEARFGRV
jgi:hypothetical protein